MDNPIAPNATTDDDTTSESKFVKILRCHVWNPVEALALAQHHRQHARAARDLMPQYTTQFRDYCRAAALAGRARNHDEMAAACESHATRLQALSHKAATPARHITQDAEGEAPTFERRNPPSPHASSPSAPPPPVL